MMCYLHFKNFTTFSLNIYQQLSKNPTCKIFYELNLLLYIITHNPTENLQLIQFYPSSNKDKLLDWTVMEGPCDATWLYQVLQFSLDHHLKTSFIDALAKKLTIKDPEFIPMMELLLHNSRRRGALKKIKINEKEHISLNFRLAICHYTKNDEVQKIYREIVKILKNPQKRLLIFQKFLDLHQLEINLKTPVKILEKGYPSYFLMNAPIREQLEPIGELYRFCPRGNEDINHYHENNFYQYLVNHSLPLKSLSIDDFSEFFHFFQKSKFSTNSPPYFYEVLLIEYVHNQLEILSQTDPDAYLVNYASFLKSLESKLFSPSLNSTPQQDALKDVLTAAKMYGDPALFLESCYSKNKKSSFIYLSLGWKYLKYFLPAENFLQLFPKFSKSTNQDLLNHPQLLNIILKADLNQVRDLINDPKLQHYQALEIKDGLLAKTYKNPLELALGVKFILDCYHLFPIELLPEDQDCIIQSTHKFCPNLKDYSLKQEDHDQTSLLNKLKDIYEDPSFSHNLKAIIENYYITLLSLPVVEFDQMEYLLEMMIGIFHHKINKTTIDFQLVKRLEMLKTNISVDWGTEQKDRIIKMFEKLDKYINPSLKRKASEALEEAPESKKQKLVS